MRTSRAWRSLSGTEFDAFRAGEALMLRNKWLETARARTGQVRELPIRFAREYHREYTSLLRRLRQQRKSA